MQNRNAGQKIGANIAGIVISIVWPIVPASSSPWLSGSLTAAYAGLGSRCLPARQRRRHAFTCG
ncbi:MAG: hypothetical protein R2717_01510 [Schumannella sp.]